MNVTMPQLGETIVEGTILKWLKAEGERVELDEPLFEISTDKVDTEVPSPVAGVVQRILVAEGQTVPVGTDLAVVGDAVDASAPGPVLDQAPSPEAAAAEPGLQREAIEGDEAAAAPPPPSMPEVTPPASPGPAPPVPPRAPTGVAAEAATAPVATGPRSQILSPLVRRLAAEHDVDLAEVTGTGTGGRITRQDMEDFIAAPATASATPPVAAPTPITAPPPVTSPPPAAGAHPVAAPAPAGPGDEIVPLTHMRKLIGRHMVDSLRTSARAWTMVEVNVERVVRLRQRVKDAFFEREGYKLTYTPFITRATVEALQEYSMVNAELRGEDLVLHQYVNMGMAVSIEGGLIVPVIERADTMNLIGLARAIDDVATRARAKQLTPDEVHGATFSITNPGPFGSVLSVPIINQPNAGILSIDAIQKRAVVIDDAIAIRHMVNLSMSWDHRVIDGAMATQFLARIKANLETWDFAEDLGATS